MRLCQFEKRTLSAYNHVFVHGVLIVSYLVLVMGASCDSHLSGPNLPSSPAPPDVGGCQGIITRLYPSVFDVTVRAVGVEDVFTPAELAALKSVAPHVVDKPAQIRAIAEMLRAGVYVDTENSRPRLADVAAVACYRDGQETMSFTVKSFGFIWTDKGDLFDYKGVGLDLLLFTPKQLDLRRRAECAANLREIRSKWWSPLDSRRAYPRPEAWCDATRQQLLDTIEPWVGPEQTREFRRYVTELFKCPSAKEARCHYAMNRNCQPDSPDDMVLLFETEGGWNQHGGPELFTFEHHEPHGGLVLLNDGTVKFLRTDEELHQLRWK